MPLSGFFFFCSQFKTKDTKIQVKKDIPKQTITFNKRKMKKPT